MIEKWKEYYSDEELSLIQNILVGNLKELDRVCKILGITWMVYGGSLLGTVKYKGFVPWDDDLDICMLREDYEKLIEEGPKLLGEKYELQHPSVTPKTEFPFIKLRRKDTTMASYEVRNSSLNQGVYLDIYPLDYLPEDAITREKRHRLFSLFSRLYSIRQTSDVSEQPIGAVKKIKVVIRGFIRFFLLFIPARFFYRLLHKIETKCNARITKVIGNYFYPKPVNYFETDNLGFRCDSGLFENICVKLPAGYMGNLKNRYGDISIDPPVEERVGHRPYKLELENYSEEKHEF